MRCWVLWSLDTVGSVEPPVAVVVGEVAGAPDHAALDDVVRPERAALDVVGLAGRLAADPRVVNHVVEGMAGRLARHGGSFFSLFGFFGGPVEGF